LKIFRQRLRQRQKQNEGMLECGIEEKKKKARIKNAINQRPVPGNKQPVTSNK
jgi:hypothetical protein